MHLLVLTQSLRVPYASLMHYTIKILWSVIAEKSLHYLGQINLKIITQSYNISKSKMGAL